MKILEGRMVRGGKILLSSGEQLDLMDIKFVDIERKKITLMNDTTYTLTPTDIMRIREERIKEKKNARFQIRINLTLDEFDQLVDINRFMRSQEFKGITLTAEPNTELNSKHADALHWCVIACIMAVDHDNK